MKLSLEDTLGHLALVLYNVPDNVKTLKVLVMTVDVLEHF